jgi:hypothetical protein
MRRVSLTGVIVTALVGVILIAGCTSTRTPSNPQTQTAGTSQGTSQLSTANVTDSTGEKSAPATANVTVASAEPAVTKLIIDNPPSKTDYYLGDQITMKGRLVDADGNGIPNQTIRFKSVSRVLGFTYDYPIGPVTTDSTGNFTKVFDPVSSQGAPSFITTVDTESWVYYDGNALYQPTSTPHGHVTVHLTAPPSS